MRFFLIAILILMLGVSCTRSKEEVIANPDGPLSDTPRIELSKIAPKSVIALQDSIVITIFYQDGNGDIGFPEADSFSLFLTDNRLNLTQGYYVKPVAPLNADIAVQGYLKIVLPYTFMSDSSLTSEMGTFSVRLKDRAQLWSNVATSEPIEIKRN